ncbi:MAG: ABC transporter permease [Chloroflexi bacterium]|nr:ABC transporter permease [Chloroflexota bacterium]MCY3582537.1 ABC transporter permease [Chloroflexota bacterium]MCY3715288.1 ABC transporter permease [Chloroflexota bacterium]MDE2650186.1 ABC transporter permease [Chloroflexota bacterium]MXV92218.1 ABC transporter permease [Chloroflexota bacterium]
MSKYIIRRLLQAIPTVFGITLLVFFLISLAPGGPIEVLAFNNRMKPREREELKYILGYNDPLLVQYLRWLAGDDWMRWDEDDDGLADASVFFIDHYAPELDEHGKPIFDEGSGEAVLRQLPPGNKLGILRGDWGNSVYYKRAALDVLVERLPATLELGVTSLVTGFVIGIAVGIIAAVYHSGVFDQVSRVGAVIVDSVPSFGLGLMFLLVFAAQLNLLPLGGRCKTTLDDSCPPVTSRLEYLILPTIVLAAGGVSGYSRYMRASMLDVVSQDYIRTARAKGLQERLIWLRHGVRNAFIPIATFLGPSLTFLLSGAAITEQVYSWPGVGRLLVQAPGRRDYPIVMIVVVYGALASILGYLLSDVFYALLDPRIRFD